jgi:succinate dehydrogenase/fumarate reductase flavoprotein subunit
MMVGEEGKTKVPVYKNYKSAGFDPSRDVLQCYGSGWTSSNFLPQERQLFGIPGGFMNDWTLSTNIEGLYAAGDALFASNCFGHAAATGYYAGRHAAGYASANEILQPDESQITKEKQRIYAPLDNDPDTSIGWKELNMGISKTMQNYCGDIKHDELLHIGLARLQEYERKVVPNTFAYNPHELVRLLEVYDILTVSQLIIHASLARKTNARALCFYRYGDNKPEEEKDRKFITIKQKDDNITVEEVPLDFFGDLKENYKKHNADYIGGKNNG